MTAILFLIAVVVSLLAKLARSSFMVEDNAVCRIFQVFQISVIGSRNRVLMFFFFLEKESCISFH